MKKFKITDWILVILFIGVPLLYVLNLTWIKSHWDDANSIIAIVLYLTTFSVAVYNWNIRFYFFIHKILLLFRYDHTTWLISSNYITLLNELEIIPNLENHFLKEPASVRSRTNDTIEIMWSNRFLLTIRINNEGNINRIFVFTSKITVPTRQISMQSSELTHILQKVEVICNPDHNSKTTYEIDIEYHRKSPYYGFWVRKLPEQSIYDFNCKLNVSKNEEEVVSVNMNHLRIRAFNFSRLFYLAKEYISLQATI